MGRGKEKRRLRQLAKEGRLANGFEIPKGAIAADLSEQAPSNSHSVPKLYYADIEFTCVDCGVKEVWKAKQ